MRTIAAASLVLIGACAQTQEAEDPSSARAAASEPAPAAEAQSEAPAQPGEQEQAQAARAPGEKEATQRKGRVAGGSEDPSEIPVASSPSGLLKPGAEQKVRDKLGIKAGGSLRAALSKFQKEHDLPATGILDQRTAESLGLDPDDLFERANAQ